MPGTSERLLETNLLKRIFAVALLNVKAYLNINNLIDPRSAKIELSIDQAVLDLKAPVNNPIACPQLNPQISQHNFNTIKAPGLYRYDAGLSNTPTSSLNFGSIEIGRADRYSQIVMPWDADQMFFRRQRNN